MSLIQEALKRQQEDEKQPPETNTETIQSPVPPVMPEAEPSPAETQAPPPVVPPPPHQEPAKPVASPPQAPTPQAPPPTPPPVVPTEPLTVTDASKDKKKKGHPTRTLILVLVAVLIVLAGAAWMILFAVQHWMTGETTTVEFAVAIEEPVDMDGAETPPEPEAAPTPEVETPAPAAPAEDKRPSVLETLKRVAAPSTKEDGDATASRPNVKWPDLSLSGVVGKGDSGSAILNGELLSVGDSVNGVMLSGITARGVQLSYKGDHRTLKVGGTIE